MDGRNAVIRNDIWRRQLVVGDNTEAIFKAIKDPCRFRNEFLPRDAPEIRLTIEMLQQDRKF